MVDQTGKKMISEIYLVHGRDEDANAGMRMFLRALGLNVLEWSHVKTLCREPNPYVSEIVKKALKNRAVLVLMTPDEVVFLRYELKRKSDTQVEAGPAVQARPNVLLEGGLAWGLNPKHTVFVAMGNARIPSDIGSRHIERFDGSPELRRSLAAELDAAGCKVNIDGHDWLSAGREHFTMTLKREQNSDPIVERGIPAGVGINRSPYNFDRVINNQCKEIIMTGHNFADLLDPTKGAILQNVVKKAMTDNDDLRITLVFAPPDLLKAAHELGYNDLINTSIPQFAELKYGHLLTQQQQQRLFIYCLSGALSLSCFARDPNEDNGLITVTPRWITDTTASGRMFFAIRKSDNAAIYETMRKQIEVIMSEKRKAHPTAKGLREVVILLIEELQKIGGRLKIAEATLKKLRESDDP